MDVSAAFAFGMSNGTAACVGPHHLVQRVSSLRGLNSSHWAFLTARPPEGVILIEQILL
jgi:hypothetical protein